MVWWSVLQDEPFTDSVPGTLQPGNWMVVQGAPDDDADR